ncbi:MAG: hypothetical protein IJU42_00635 [Erysipelotrichaceae bacterium]|nr:hypothetical protein [Erysipelotrichaceae bacterium]
MKNRNCQILDGTMLKLIAMTSMVFDHAGDLFFHDQLWMRMIGRLAMPLFSFCIAEGYRYTKDRKKYLLRIGLFALISEIPFDLAFTGKIDLSHQNIMLTFFLSILALMISDRIRGDGKNTWKTILSYLVVLFTAILTLVVKADYTLFAVIAVFLFHIFEEKKHWIRCTVGVAFLALTRTMGYYCTTGLSIIPLLLYNGKKGKGLKWLFYLFYPGHLLLLYLIRVFLLKS